MLVVVPEVPGLPSNKPLVQGYGCRLGGGTLSCDTLYIQSAIPAQELPALFIVRGRHPKPITLAWGGSLPAGVHRNATIDLKEP